MEMRQVRACVLAVMALAAAASACTSDAPSRPRTALEQPYRGLEHRSIPALSPEEVEDLLAGNGAGYALAAELNGYPGPKHVLELGDELRLTRDQELQVQAVRAAMLKEARNLGRQLVELERRLDSAFRDQTITPTALTALTGRIGEVESRLRSVHLSAHVPTREILSDEQTARYNELRGYAEDVVHPPREHSNHDS